MSSPIRSWQPSLSPELHVKQGKMHSQATFATLPAEVIEFVADHIEDYLWPPVDSVITDWNSYPSFQAQHNLSSLSLVCRRLHNIISPRLTRRIVHEFGSKISEKPTSHHIRYQWLITATFSPWIRVMYLQDLSHYADPVIEMKSMVELLESLSGSLEVLVAKGFCASVLVHTLGLLAKSRIRSLKTLKLYAHTVNVTSLLAAFQTYPNLAGFTLDAANIEGASRARSQLSPIKSTKITHLDICTRLYNPEEYEALCQILSPILPTLKVLNLHGEYHEGMRPMVSLLTSSSIESLSMTFRNKFPQELMSIDLPSLQTLFISTYSCSMPSVWDSKILSSLTKLIMRTSGYPLDLGEAKTKILASRLEKLRVLKLQSLCPIRDPEVDAMWASEISEWCAKERIEFVNGNSDSNTINPQDAYNYL